MDRPSLAFSFCRTRTMRPKRTSSWSRGPGRAAGGIRVSERNWPCAEQCLFHSCCAVRSPRGVGCHTVRHSCNVCTWCGCLTHWGDAVRNEETTSMPRQGCGPSLRLRWPGWRRTSARESLHETVRCVATVWSTAGSRARASEPDIERIRRNGCRIRAPFVPAWCSMTARLVH